MASKIKTLREKAEKRSDSIGSLLPANWIEIKGRFSPLELRTLANAVEDNFAIVNSKK